jgi:hypothetical protein
MTMNALTGQITGTPQLSAPGIGGTTALSVTLSVTDATPSTTSRTVGLQVIDPNGPFGITAPAAATVPLAGGPVGTFTATPVTPAGFTPVSWSVSPAAGFTAANGTGQTFTLTSNGTLAAGSQTVQVTATDTPSCGGAAHTRTVSYTFTVQ